MKLRIFLILTSLFFLIGSGDANLGKDKVSTCIACHGQDGNSIVGLWPSIAGQNYKYLKRQLLLIKSGERAIQEMVGLLDQFSEKDLEDMAAFYSSENRRIGQASKDFVELGSKLYYSGSLQKGIPACTACHSPRGNGNEPAGYPLLSGQQSEYISKTLKEYRTGLRQYSDESKIMVSIAYKLDDKEIEALASFINGLY